MILMILKCIGSIIFGIIKCLFVYIFCIVSVFVRIFAGIIALGGNMELADKMDDKLMACIDWAMDWELPFLKIHP